MTRYLNSGELFKVSDQEHAHWQRAGLANARLGQGIPGQQSLTLPDSIDGIILVKNNTPRRLPQYSVLGLDLNCTIPNPAANAQQLVHYKNNPAVRGEIPTSDHSGRFCVLQTHAEPYEVVPAMVSGVTPVRLSVTSTTDQFADIDSTLADPSEKLKTGASGAAQVIDHAGVTGDQWGLIRMSNKPPRQVALAYFTAHVNPYVTAYGPYSYPSRTASTQDRIFPAYIRRNVTFVDNPSLPGWTVTPTPSTAGSNFSEPVFVFSSRYTYIPSSNYLLPVFEIDGKWYCDYIRPYNQVKIYGSALTLGTSPTTLTGGTCDNGVGSEAGHPLSYDSTTGVITFHRQCRASIHVNLVLENNATPTGEYYVQSGYAGGSTTSGTNTGFCFFPANVGTLKQTMHWHDVWNVGAGLTTSIVAQMDTTAGGRACNLYQYTISIETFDALI